MKNAFYRILTEEKLNNTNLAIDHHTKLNSISHIIRIIVLWAWKTSKIENIYIPRNVHDVLPQDLS